MSLTPLEKAGLIYDKLIIKGIETMSKHPHTKTGHKKTSHKTKRPKPANKKHSASTRRK